MHTTYNARLEKRIQHRIQRTSARLTTPSKTLSAAGHRQSGDTVGELAVHDIVRNLAATRELNVVVATLREMTRIEEMRHDTLLDVLASDKARIAHSPAEALLADNHALEYATGVVQGRARTLDDWVHWLEKTFVDALSCQHDVRTPDDLAYELAQPVRRP